MGVRIRSARKEDKAHLMGFIRHVWGGHDYIPSVWDEWLRDRRGRMFVVEVDGVPVGMNRVTFLDDGSAWFQGVRVHPRFRGRGLATRLGENSISYAAEKGARVFRLTTASRNYASRRQIAKMGFGEIARFGVYGPPGGARTRAGSFKDAGGEAEEMAELVRSSKEFRLGHGVYWHNFAASALTPPVLTRLVREGAVRRVGGAVAIDKEGGEGSEKWEQVCFVGGPPGDAGRLVEAAVGKVKGAKESWTFVPGGSPVVHELRERGFRRLHSQILFERRSAIG